jgi:prophage DNA circulation protein
MTVFEQYPVASWKVGSLPALKFPVSKISESGSNRLVKRDRPYRDGTKLDDTGSNAKQWNITVVFDNGIIEEGLDGSKPLYPDVLNELIASFDIHETGDLVVPTRGRVRVRAETYQRDETESERDEAVVVFAFLEDNEDNVGANAFEPMSIHASANRLTEQTVFSATSEGSWGTSLADLNEFAGELEGLANYPGDTVANIDSQVSIVIGAANRVGRAFTRESEENRNMLNDPQMSLTQRKLEETKDMAARARAEAYKGRPRLVPYFVTGDTDLFSIAALLDSAAEDIIELNRSIDPFYVTKGTTINVMEKA